MIKNNDKKVILDIQGLKKYFLNNGNINKAVDDVSFNLHEGEIVGLIGESGSGKTTVGRSLLRLYNDFNGFVTLDGKIISGKHLSKKQEKFLRKRIQMIFQDPHASLNGQKTIYSILKEPLIVNGIIKQKTHDLFSDWDAIKKNYPFSFLKYAKELKIKNLRAITSLAQVFFKKWTDILTNFQFDFENETIDENFISYFNYLEEKQSMESDIINSMYSNTDDLMAFYYEKQKLYRNKELTFDEIDYENAKDNYKLAKSLSKYSQKQYDAINQKKEIENQIKEHKSNVAEHLISNKNAIQNFLSEYKNEIRICKYARLNTYNVDLYFFNYKKEITNKIKHKLIKENSEKIRYLSIEQVKYLVSELNNYTSNFYKDHLEEIPIKRNFKKIANDVLNTYFKFDFAKYIKASETNKRNFQEEEKKLLSLKNKCEKIINSTTEKPEYSEKELNDAKEALDKAYKIMTEENNKYADMIKADIKELDIEILNESLLYKKLKIQQTYTNNKFAEINKKFFAKLKQDLNNAKKNKDKEQIEEISRNIKVYQQKISNKYLTLKSFEIEVKHLFKDVRTIYFLLGIKQSSNPLFNLYNKIFAKKMITELITRSIIYKALEDVGLLKQFAYRYPHEFSGGQRQRIVIARALITEPKVIIADEPIASLDISIQAQVVNLLKDLCEQKNIGMLFIAHDLSMIEYIADRVQIMHLGKIVESGNTDVVYKQPMHPYTINLFKAIPKISNANEKFENINFELDYLKGQKYPNIPETYLVEDNHYLYGTKDQVVNWVRPFNLSEPVLAKSIYNEEDRLHKPFDGRVIIPEDIEYTLLMEKNKESAEISIASVSLDKNKTKGNKNEK
ncbi:ATP-binding cassette domain-containing protein [Mycoplasmopsis primatum]|uniref:ATP-binding cassette domain-containing protein n=1 Tax=Mycoplasmopsis primatum TaxID=55604 RepID=UPI000A05CA25|nr:ATP-binding cassette domain-containing protein [Mycoplasmopsis primatum]